MQTPRYTITVSLSKETYQVVNGAAEAADISNAEYLRVLLEKETRTEGSFARKYISVTETTAEVIQFDQITVINGKKFKNSELAKFKVMFPHIVNLETCIWGILNLHTAQYDENTGKGNSDWLGFTVNMLKREDDKAKSDPFAKMMSEISERNKHKG